MYDSLEVKKDTPVIFIELTDRRSSGYILDGTRDTKEEFELNSPTMRFIRNTGKRFNEQIGRVEDIRYIKGRDEISVDEQKQKGIIPNKATSMEDLIGIKDGTFSVKREYPYIGLYDYLIQSFDNESNPHRPESKTAIYRVIELGKKEEKLNELSMMEADAVQLIGTLYQKVGDKKYRYNTDKINALCELFLVFAETEAGKIHGLMAHAKRNPENFLKKATRFEQTTITEIAHALELSVIKFEGNTATYIHKDKVIRNLGKGNISHDTKVQLLADFLRSPEGNAAYLELRAELEAAQTKL